MQSVYIATITADHDFNNCVAIAAFQSRIDASRWAFDQCEGREVADKLHDPSFAYGYAYTSHVVSVPFFAGEEA